MAAIGGSPSVMSEETFGNVQQVLKFKGASSPYTRGDFEVLQTVFERAYQRRQTIVNPTYTHRKVDRVIQHLSNQGLIRKLMSKRKLGWIPGKKAQPGQVLVELSRSSQPEKDYRLSMGDGPTNTVCRFAITSLGYIFWLTKRRSLMGAEREIRCYQCLHEGGRADGIARYQFQYSHPGKKTPEAFKHNLVALYRPFGDLFGFIANNGKVCPDNVIAYLQIYRGILDGLVSMQKRGVVQRDGKPENVLVTHGESGYGAELCDFEYGCTPESDQRDLEEIKYTDSYCSPEKALLILQRQLIRKPEIVSSHKTDVWSYGFVLVIMLLGGSPFLKMEGDTTLRIETLKAICKQKEPILEESDSEPEDLYNKMIHRLRQLANLMTVKNPADRIDGATALGFFKEHIAPLMGPLEADLSRIEEKED